MGVYIAAALMGGLAFTNLALGQAAPDSPAAPGQPPAASPNYFDLKSLPLLENLTLEEAQEKSKKTNRLLMVFWCGPTPDSPNWPFVKCSRSITVRAYIKWHAVAIHASKLSPKMEAQAIAELRRWRQGTPAVVIWRDGEVEAAAGTIPMRSAVRGNSPDAIAMNRMYPTPIRVLYQADFAMDRIAARDPVWKMLHDRDNPAPPPPPEPEPMNSIRDELAPVVYDPKPEEKIGVIDRLDEARRLVKHGDLYQATGVYTWLWERGAELDPAFRPARLSVLVQEMAALGSKRPGSKQRFTNIRDVRTERLPWAEYGQMHDWFALNAASGDAGPTLEYFDYCINDEDEGAMIPPADNRALHMLGRREDFGKAWELPKNPVARVALIVERMSARFPTQVNEQNRAEFKAFANQFLLDEGSRLYAACLVKGDEISAQQIAEMVIKARNDAAARRSLVITALSADPPQARAIHTTWLDQAQTLDGDSRPDLRNRITLGVKPVGEIGK